MKRSLGETQPYQLRSQECGWQADQAEHGLPPGDAPREALALVGDSEVEEPQAHCDAQRSADWADRSAFHPRASCLRLAFVHQLLVRGQVNSETAYIRTLWYSLGMASESPFRLPKSPERADLVAKYFRGLGDPTRLRILELLRAEDELSVGELVERLGIGQTKVSNHLACLRWCGFVEARREHRTVYNRIADERVITLIDLGSGLLEDNEEHVAACERIEP